MAHTTIEQFATELKMPAGALLEQLGRAGVAGKKEGDKLSEVDKTRLLEYLQKQHGAAGEPKKKITLTRKQTTEIKAAGSMGKARTIQVEVRKKRVFMKRDETEAAAPVEEVVRPAAAPVITPEELAAREAEEKKAQVLIARQQEEIQQKQQQAVKRKTKKEKEAEEAAVKAVAEAAAAEAAKAAQAAQTETAKAPAAKAKAPGEGTLHRPAAKPGEKARTVKKSGTAFQEEAARRRALKLRGDVTGGAPAATGWRQPKVGHRRHDEEGGEVGATATAGPIVREVSIPETITVADLAHKMSVKAAELIKALMKLGQMVTINQVLDQETAMILVEEMGHKAIPAKLDDPDALLAESEATTVEAEPRPPVVTVMGHVDARARRQGHRHRGAGRCRRRRRDAADEGSDRPCEGRQRAGRRRDEQDRQAGGQPRARQAGARRRRCDPRGIRRRNAIHPRVGEDRRGNRRAARRDPAAGRSAGAEGAEGCASQGHRDRIAARQGPRSRGNGARAFGDAQTRRHRPRRRGLRSRARDDRRDGEERSDRRSSDSGRDPGPVRRAARRRERDGAGRRAQGARDRTLPPGQVPRRQAREATGGEAREHVRPDGGGRDQVARAHRQGRCPGQLRSAGAGFDEALDRRG